MNAVRVIVTIEYATSEAAERALPELKERFAYSKTEEGAVQYELFRSVDNPARLVLQELWASQELYDKHWIAQTQRQTSTRAKDPDRKESRCEFYRFQEFAQVDSVWQPKDPSQRSLTIRWI